jgi:hypothetical protein
MHKHIERVWFVSPHSQPAAKCFWLDQRLLRLVSCFALFFFYYHLFFFVSEFGRLLSASVIPSNTLSSSWIDRQQHQGVSGCNPRTPGHGGTQPHPTRIQARSEGCLPARQSVPTARAGPELSWTRSEIKNWGL